jgi:hypothetical protein
VFTANASNPTATLMDALNFAGAGIGTSVNIASPVKAINGVKVPVAFYDSAFASTMHTYKIVWTPTTVAWLVDTSALRARGRRVWRIVLADTMHARAPLSCAVQLCIATSRCASAPARRRVCTARSLLDACIDASACVC